MTQDNYRSNDFENNPNNITVTLYPSTLKNHKLPVEFYSLPEKIKKVYFETIEALRAECFLLA